MNTASNPRPVTAFDCALLAELHGRIFTAPWDQPLSAESLAQILAMPGAVGWIIERDGSPLGFALARFTMDEGEILLSGVLPTERGRGLGKRLMLAAIEAARAAGVTRLFLEHAETNEAAAALYRSLAFSRIGRRHDYYVDAAGRQHDAITLALTLSDAVEAATPAAKPPSERNASADGDFDA